MSAEGVTNTENVEEVEEMSTRPIPPSQEQDMRCVIEGQLQCVSKHMDNIASFVMESSQLKADALKCFEDNVTEMRKLEEETDFKTQAFKNMLTMVGIAVGVSNSN